MASISLTAGQRRAAIRDRLSRLAGSFLLQATLIFGTVLTMAPFVWLLGVAFRPVSETYVVPMNLLPRSLTLENFLEVLERFTRTTSLLLLYRNSLIITGITVALILVCCSLGGFAFARLRFPGRDALFWMVTIAMWMPSTTALPALYEMMARWGINDTLLALILPYTGWHLSLGNFIMRSAFQSIPRDLEDAAVIDGAGVFRLFRMIMLPLTASSLVTVAIFTFVPVWGEFLMAFTFTSTTKAMPISIGIRLLQPGPSMGEWTFPVAATAALISFIPPLIIYFGLQRWFTKGLLEGALKF